MALTRGERKVVTTASSVANRMGIVSAVSDDPLASRMEVITDKLDFFAKRAATNEEIKYKADVDVKSYKMIQELGRKHFDDPDGYVVAVDAYKNTLVEESPVRFKEWTKGKVGMDAAREGENIINRKLKMDWIQTGQSMDQRTAVLDEQATLDMFNMPLDQIDTYLNENYKVKLGEIYKDMVEHYNTSYPDEQQQFIRNYGGTPDVWLRKKQLGFEQLRVNNWIKHEVDDMMTEILDNKYSYQVGQDLLTQLNTKIQKKLSTYLVKPDFQPTDGNATFTGSTTDERAGIIEGAKKFLDAQSEQHKKTLSRYQMEGDVEKTEAHNKLLDGFLNNPEDHVGLDRAALIATGINLGFESGSDEMQNLIDQHALGQQINYHSDYYMPKRIGTTDELSTPLMSFDSHIRGELYAILERKGLLDSIQGDDKVEALKQLVINQNLKKLFGADDLRDLNIGKMSFYERDQRETIEGENGDQLPNPDFNEIIRNKHGEIIENKKLAMLAAYSQNLGEPIPAITNFLSTVSDLSYKTEEGLDSLDKAAFLANYFDQRDGFAFVWKDVEFKELVAPLLKYHKIRQLNTSLVTRETVAEDFFATLNMDNTVKGDIKTAIDGFVKFDDEDETGDINFTKMVNDAIKNDRWYQKHATGFYRSYETGDKISAVRIGTLDRLLEIDSNKVKQIIKPILDIYITSAYNKGAEVTEKHLRMTIHNMLKYALDDFEKEGFNWRGY